jgi:hypothetical protein
MIEYRKEQEEEEKTPNDFELFACLLIDFLLLIITSSIH